MSPDPGQAGPSFSGESSNHPARLERQLWSPLGQGTEGLLGPGNGLGLLALRSGNAEQPGSESTTPLPPLMPGQRGNRGKLNNSILKLRNRAS